MLNRICDKYLLYKHTRRYMEFLETTVLNLDNHYKEFCMTRHDNDYKDFRRNRQVNDYLIKKSFLKESCSKK